MLTRYLKPVILLFMGVLAVGCAAQKPMTPFMAKDLAPNLQSGDYVQKVENFMIITDASDSMAGSKLQTADKIVRSMNETIPEMPLQAGLRRFGMGNYGGGAPTALLYGPTAYTKEGLEGGLAKIHQANGESPMGGAIDAAADDIKGFGGDTALIIVSDGLDMDDSPITAAKNIKAAYGSRLCIYTILVGGDPDGRFVLQRVAEAGQCGFSVTADEVSSEEGMADFVRRVFLERTEKPVPPPPPVKMVEPPKPAPPMDSDGDGVIDAEDQCPGTPMGAEVNDVGCWVLKNVEFDFDKWDIKPRYEADLDRVTEVLKRNPDLRVEVEGHTDSIGTAVYNQQLSERRAASVVEYLVNAGIERGRLEPVGYGLTKPIATNDTREGRARNRRVQLKPLM